MTTQEHKAHSTEFIVMMASLMSVTAITIDALLPALGVISDDLQIASRNHAQYLISGIFAGLAVGQLMAGPLSDALGRKRVLFVGIALYLVGTIVAYTAQSLEMILLGRFIQGVGAAGPQISAVSIVRDKFAGRQMARLMSIVMMVFMAVPALAPSLGQAVMFATDWRGIFILYFVYALIVGTWIFFRLEETLPKEKRIPFHVKNIVAGFREVFTTRRSMFYMICMGICFGSLIGYLNSSQQIFQDQFGAGSMFAVYFGVLAAVLAVASMTNSRIVVRFGMRYIAARAFAGIAVSSIVFLAIHAFVDIELWMFMTYAACLFFCFGLTFGNLNALAMEPMGHVAGIAAAVIGFVSSILSMTIGSAIGQMYDGTLIPMTCGFLVLSLSASCMMWLAEKCGKPA